jgi:flagellar biosynthesis chaperone FliJ
MNNKKINNQINYTKSDTLNFVNENTNSIYTKYSHNNLGGRKGRIARTKSVDKINNIFYQNYDDLNNNINNKDDINDFRPQKSQINDKRIKEMEKTINNLEKQRNIYLNEYNKLPENPKTQKELNEKRKLKRLIDEFNTNIYNVKSQEKNMKKGIKSN